MHNRLLLPLTVALAACQGQNLDHATHPTGSSTLTASSDGSRVYAVNADAGTVSIVRVDGTRLAEVAVGRDPQRIARANGRVYVTLRGDRGLAVLVETESGLSLERILSLGSEPFGVVASEDGHRLFVALSGDDAIVEVEVSSLTVTRRIGIAGQPRWLALHPAGQFLYVGTAYAGAAMLDLDSASVATLRLPEIQRVAGFGGANLLTNADTSGRITGDPAVSPDGSFVVFPALYVDHHTPVNSSDVVTNSSTDGYASGGEGIDRLTPIIIQVPTDDSGRADDSQVTSLMAGVSAQMSGMASPTSDMPPIAVGGPSRSYPSSVTVSPDGLSVWVTQESSNTVLEISAVPTRADLDLSAQKMGGTSNAPLILRPTTLIGTGMGPRGVAFLDETTAFVHNFLDRSVQDVDFEAAHQALADNVKAGVTHNNSGLAAQPAVRVTDFSLPTDAGRNLFYSATDPRMAAFGAGVSCSTCHFDGRHDGLTWTFDIGLRQTPTLAGEKSDTAPFTWTIDVATVADEVLATSQGRMGGHDLRYGDAAQIASYIEAIARPDVPELDAAAVARGKAIFERADTACATCHGGPANTDNDYHAMYGLNLVNTPSLRGLASSAPYLHDGRAADLDALFLETDAKTMGDTSMLTDSDKADLKAYLRSL